MSKRPIDSPRLAGAGEVQVQFLMCKSCGLCAEYCPQDLLVPASDIPAEDRDGQVMNPSGHVVYAVYDPEGKCTGCGICATVCPEGAVVVYRRKKETAGAGDQGSGAGGPGTAECGTRDADCGTAPPASREPAQTAPGHEKAPDVENPVSAQREGGGHA